MNNFQLYRTNLYLGGQMKWDLVIDSNTNTLHVSDFHLTPISKNTPYTYRSDEYLIKNLHQDNVKSYYSRLKGHFYEKCLNAEHTHSWPLICEPNEVLSTYSDIYDMGCRRSLHYDVYKKQFEFFCPLWIEHLYGDLSFKIDIKCVDSDSVLASNVLRLSTNGNKFHDDFVNYLNAYLKDADILNGNDDVLNINFKTNKATINGLNAQNGIFETKDINSLVNNIVSRERPLLEFDNLLIQTFVDNYMIAKQLFNFNLCFNIDDILTGSIANMMVGEDITISVSVLINDTVLECRDFDTEYEYIKKDVMPIDCDETFNVLDYLHDYECVELIDKNKFSPSVCHWSLCNNEDYLFNVYNGFSGLMIYGSGDDAALCENEHQYGYTPNTLIKFSDNNTNSTGWVNTQVISSWNRFYKYIQNTNKYKKDGTFIKDNNYINGLKYNYVPNIDDGIYIINMIVADKVLSSIVNAFECIDLYNRSVYMLCKDDLIMIMSNNSNNLSFGKFCDILYGVDTQTITNEKLKLYITELYKMLKSVVQPELIIIKDGLRYCAATGPVETIKEVTYYKDNNIFDYVVRYDGKIKPKFVVKNNTIYYKDYISDSDIESSRLKSSAYSTYNSANLEPLYPSIGYCAIKKTTEWTYDEIPEVTVSEYDNNVSLISNKFEYNWFNNNKYMIISPLIEFEYIASHNDTYDHAITSHLKKYYNINDDNKIAYIKSLYDHKCDWEYYSIDNIDDYVYRISLKLK